MSQATRKARQRAAKVDGPPVSVRRQGARAKDYDTDDCTPDFAICKRCGDCYSMDEARYLDVGYCDPCNDARGIRRGNDDDI